MHVSRWRCGHRRCETAIFADRLTGVSAPRVQDTQLFGAVGHLVSHALGGWGGERLLALLGMAISNGTILRLLTRPATAPLAPEVLRVVGIDDWALAEGPAPLRDDSGGFGAATGRGRPPGAHGRCGGAWLAAHPDIVIKSRDRHGPYAEGVPRGAPQATQVADRFHLVLNLRGAVQQELSRLRSFLGVSYGPVAVPTNGGDPAVIAPHRRASAVVDDQHHVMQQRRALQLERFHVVKRLPNWPGDHQRDRHRPGLGPEMDALQRAAVPWGEGRDQGPPAVV